MPVAAERLQGRPAARARSAAPAPASGRSAAPGHRPLVRMLADDRHSVLVIGTGLMRSLAGLPCPVRIGSRPTAPTSSTVKSVTRCR